MNKYFIENFQRYNEKTSKLNNNNDILKTEPSINQIENLSEVMRKRYQNFLEPNINNKHEIDYTTIKTYVPFRNQILKYDTKLQHDVNFDEPSDENEFFKRLEIDVTKTNQLLRIKNKFEPIITHKAYPKLDKLRPIQINYEKPLLNLDAHNDEYDSDVDEYEGLNPYAKGEGFIDRINKRIEEDPPHVNVMNDKIRAMMKNPIRGSPVLEKKEVKKEKPYEVFELLKKEKIANEKRMAKYAENVNIKLRNIMTNLDRVSIRLKSREEELKKYQEKEFQMKAENIEHDLEMLKKRIKTPIPIYGKLMLPKNYEKIDSKWKIMKKLVNIILFYYTLLKYGKNRKVKEGIFKTRNNTYKKDFVEVREWIYEILKPLIEEFNKLEFSLADSFTSEAKSDVKNRNFQLISTLIRKFLNVLNDSTLKIGISSLPKNIVYILYTYIVEKFYFHPNFLSSFEINRLEFNIKGETVNMNNSRRGMILAFFLINKVICQRILLKPNEIYVNNKDIIKFHNVKIIASLIHYFTRDSFKSDPLFIKSEENLKNYYKNYKVDNFRQFPTANSDFQTDLDYGQVFDFDVNLIEESELREYIRKERNAVEEFKKDIFDWGCEFGESLNRLWKYRTEFINTEDILNSIARVSVERSRRTQKWL